MKKERKKESNTSGQEKRNQKGDQRGSQGYVKEGDVVHMLHQHYLA